METILLKCYADIQLLPAMLAGRWWLVLLLLIAVALFGRRIYCRFLCPLGLAQSLVRGFAGKRRICSRLDGVSIRSPWVAVRLVILAVVLLVGFMGLGWQWLDPYAIASRAACWFTSPEFDWVGAAFALVPVIVVLLLAIGFGGRIWCNWICPIGTLLAFVGAWTKKVDKVKKRAGCDSCGRCFK